MLQYIQKKYYRNKWRTMVLDEYLEYLKHKGDKPLTIQWVREKGLAFWEWLNNVYPENQPVDNMMIQSYFNYRTAIGLSPSTVAGDARALYAFFKWCKDVGHLPVNPCEGVQKPKHVPCQAQPFTPAEIVRLLNYCCSKGKPRDSAIILLLYDTGCRVTAMCNITKYDIDLSRHIANVTDKYSKSRRISWGDRTNTALLDYLKTRQDTTEYLFLNERRPEKLTRSGIYRMFKRTCNGAGVIFRKPHMLRSSFACQFLMNGGPDRAWQLQMAMGLADDSQIKQVYGRSVMQDMTIEAMRELSAADRLPFLPPPYPSYDAPESKSERF